MSEVDTPHLSTRELEVLQVLSDNPAMLQKEAAQVLGMATKTVYTHASRIRAKLNVKTTAEAIAEALSLGLITQRPKEPESLEETSNE